MTTEQPEALRLADELCEAIAEYPEPTALEAKAAAELRRQHARITELESQLAQRFDAADMATAAAQGFRDGVASLTAQAAESVPDGPRRKDMLWATVKMQERYDQRIENIVSGLERIKQEHAGQQPQKIDEGYGDCPTDSEIDVMVAAYLGDCGPQATRVYSFARAVLEKWGQPAGATKEVENLRKALVYAAFALHGTPQYMLAQGITLIDGDTVRVSRDGWTVEASVNPHRQPAPATQQPEGDVVAYLDVGASGYLDLGAALSEDALQQLPKGRHALVIAGTYGIDGYVAAPQPSYTAQAAESVPAIQGEMNVQLDIDSNHSAPGQQRDMACSLALGQPVGNGSDQVAGHPSAQGDKLLTVAERNIRSFLRSATFKSESDREAALNCVDVLWEAARASEDSVLEDAARLDWLLLRISGAEFRRLGVHYSGNARRADVDAARKQGANHDNA
ncbi:hypothetical protein J8G26_08795 [Acidovorax sp. JG5]|uniref:hypothetical protein n=1 Tax=Acidovorax sp. JG5 TaxID=2822718 RepID=UPI001B31DD78|nr:hypothetical protein [Acidovorax sp. JG5]MBP3980823.1 hypothetical protein [Acidovorax sp. JG5]